MKTIQDLENDLTSSLMIAANPESGMVVSRIQLIQRLLELLGGWQGLLAGLDREEVRKLVINFYQTYIKPLDIPGVPFLFESLVDEAIERLLNRVIDRLFDEVQQVS